MSTHQCMGPAKASLFRVYLIFHCSYRNNAGERSRLRLIEYSRERLGAVPLPNIDSYLSNTPLSDPRGCLSVCFLLSECPLSIIFNHEKNKCIFCTPFSVSASDITPLSLLRTCGNGGLPLTPTTGWRHCRRLMKNAC